MAPTRVTKFVQGALAVIALGSVQRASALWISYGEEVISEGVADVFDVELYLAQFGLAYSLPLLEVTYEGNKLWAGPILDKSKNFDKKKPLTVHTGDPMISKPPSAFWYQNFMGRNEIGTLMFVDLGPKSDSPWDTADEFFPYIHSIWTDCKQDGNLQFGPANCATDFKGVGYKPPGNDKVKPNRYTWVLLSHPDKLIMSDETLAGGLSYAASLGYPVAEAKYANFSFNALIDTNPGLTMVAGNFMNVGAKDN